jgi:hypothetical protein
LKSLQSADYTVPETSRALGNPTGTVAAGDLLGEAPLQRTRVVEEPEAGQ